MWRLVKSLYGRRAAGPNFLDHSESVLLKIPGFTRGTSEPCPDCPREWGVAVTHH